MRFGVLGPLAVWTAGDRVVKIAELKVRGLLADLLVHAGRPVPASRLIDDLWGDRLPANPTNTLQTRVSQLRRALDAAEPGGRELVVSQPPGYLLRVDPEAVDADRFRALVTAARAATDPRVRAATLADALALWRGPAYADFGEEPFARAAIDRLEEERLVAVEERAEARLALGEHAPLVAELADLVGRHPLRQRLRAAYMHALYRSGRHSEALDTYGELRDHLADALGLDPGAELVALQQAILRQDPDLAPSAPVPAGPRTNLPAPLTSLIGREEAAREVADRLATGRLVTLTGPGGVGKTRLAVETARGVMDRYEDGVWLVELAAITPTASLAALDRSDAIDQGPGGAGESVAAQLVRVTAGALRLAEDALAPAEDVDELVERLAAALRDRRSLLVLDNCEHVIEPVAKLTELLLRAAAGLRVLATSREPLEVPGELLWEVPPLELPDPAAAEPAVLAKSSAVQLFVARAGAAAPGFGLAADNARAVASICHRLDGIPLALELAATRVRGLGVHEVAARLDDRFRLLAGGRRGAPARQQTLQAVIDWSWGLLTEPERVVLRRLALHADTCTLPAAQVVCAGDGVDPADVPELLARLVDRSLVVRIEAPAGVRYRLLESVSAYCLERLHESGEFPQVLRRHIAYYTGLSTHNEPRLYGHDPLVRYLGEVGEHRVAKPAAPAVRSGQAPGGRVRSRDGTPIAYDRYGDGPPVVLVGGALNDRATFTPLATRLAPRFTVFSYDRRGRAGSGDTPPYEVAREIEDLAAVVEAAGGSAYAFGVSSGAVLPVEAAAGGVALTRLVLIEPPFIMDDTREPMPDGFVARLDELVAAGRPGDAVELFLTVGVEMPAEVVAAMRTAPTWPALEGLAHTIGYDLTIMGDFQLPARWASVTAPTLVMDGWESAAWRKHAARATVAALPNGVHRTLDGHPHDAPPEVLAPILEEFFGGR
jgi:predicted ATPase/DNA-binding SARP family transcriptional activator